MRKRIYSAALFVGVLLVACGGSDAIDDAENCSELATAVAQIGELSDDQWERASEKATEMAGDAAASGLDVEFVLCTTVAIDLVAQEVEETFDEISSGLDQ